MTALFPGVNETRALVTGKTYDKTEYLNYGVADYNPAAATSTTFNAEGRADYSPSAAELLAGAPDLHQNHTLPLRMRRLDWGVQIKVANAAGSLRLAAVEVGGMQREVTSAEAV